MHPDWKWFASHIELGSIYQLPKNWVTWCGYDQVSNWDPHPSWGKRSKIPLFQVLVLPGYLKFLGRGSLLPAWRGGQAMWLSPWKYISPLGNHDPTILKGPKKIWRSKNPSARCPMKGSKTSAQQLGGSGSKGCTFSPVGASWFDPHCAGKTVWPKS